MYFTAFYSVILPLGMIISMFGLILTFYIDKVNFLVNIKNWLKLFKLIEKKNILRNRTVKYTLSTSLCIEMTEMVEYILPIYAGANWIFFYFVTGDKF